MNAPERNPPDASDEKAKLYIDTIARLEKQIAGLEAMRRTLKWYFVACLVLAVPAFFAHWLASLGVLILGGSIWGVGGYLAFVHVSEDKHAIADAREILASLRGEAPPHAARPNW
jgi:hypothetical protein